MQYRMFGEQTGIKMSHLALGTGMFGTVDGCGAESEEAGRFFNSYAEAGGNVVDTLKAYQLGPAETLAGEFTAFRRGEFVIASKYSRGAAAHPWSTALGDNHKGMVRSVEDSLKRLRIVGPTPAFPTSTMA